MDEYIKREDALKIIDNYSKAVTEDGNVVVNAIRDIVAVITPTADVVPKSEVDNWYQLYHSIKEELKQEKMYHRETEKLCDRYCIESQHAKQEVAREIFEELENHKDKIHGIVLLLPEELAELKKKYIGGDNDS